MNQADDILTRVLSQPLAVPVALIRVRIVLPSTVLDFEVLNPVRTLSH